MSTFTITSNKGKNILIHHGFDYHQRRVSKNKEKVYWRCSLRQTCNATCVSNNVNVHPDQPVTVLKVGKKHTHFARHVEIEVRQVNDDIRTRAKENPNLPPNSIVQEALANITDKEVIVHLPERQGLLRNVNRHQNVHHPPLPQIMIQAEIVEPYNKTTNGRDFLQYDSGLNDPDRILIFSTNQDLRNLSNSPILLADGTFKTVPTLFQQMYTLHGIVRGYCFPLVYCLCVRKDEATYRRIGGKTVELCQQMRRPATLQPRVVLTDFEMAAMNAARATFPDATIRGCLFHFSQSVWRSVVREGLKDEYLNRAVSNQFRQLMALSFVPLEHNLEVFDDIASTD